VAKKNKGAAQVDVAGLKRSVATAKEESKAQLDRMQKQLRDQQSQMDQTHSALLAAQAQVKGMEREKEQLKAQLASTSSTSAAASTGVTALHESIRRLERENTTLKEKSNAAAALAAREAMAKDKELRELRARLASGAQHPKQAWSEESNEIRSRWVTAPVEGAAEDDTENAGMGSINLQPVKTSGKKRRSGEAGMADSPGEKKLILEDTTSTGASVRRAQTASRIAAPMIQVPILGINALQANSAALNGGAANSARTGAKRTLVQPPAAATARSTRARPATAAPIASPQQSPLKPLPSVAMEESDDNDNTPQAASTGAPLSITEAAMAKLQERRNKYKLEKAAAASKKQPATGGWKM
jgi:hypothetical protein